jgi:DNA-directed RNA polymerase subunit beta'
MGRKKKTQKVLDVNLGKKVWTDESPFEKFENQSRLNPDLFSDVFVSSDQDKSLSFPQTKQKRPERIKKLKQALLRLKTNHWKLQDLHASYDYLQLRIASAQTIQSWASRIFFEEPLAQHSLVQGYQKTFFDFSFLSLSERKLFQFFLKLRTLKKQRRLFLEKKEAEKRFRSRDSGLKRKKKRRAGSKLVANFLFQGQWYSTSQKVRRKEKSFQKKKKRKKRLPFPLENTDLRSEEGNLVVLGKLNSADTLDFFELEPESPGLFCEVLFGPIKSYYCKCKPGSISRSHRRRKYYPFAFRTFCDRCFVEYTDSRVRRYRMAYLELLAPIVHFWYFTTKPKYLPRLLELCLTSNEEDFSSKEMRNHIYYTYPDEIIFTAFSHRFTLSSLQEWKESCTKLSKHNRIPHYLLAKFGLRTSVFDWELETMLFEESFVNTDPVYLAKRYAFPKIFNKAGATKRKGAEVLKAALDSLDLKKESERLREELLFLSSSASPTDLSSQEKYEYTQMILLLESFLSTKSHPSSLIFTHFPVLPPGLRPLLELPDGLLVSADPNDMYRSIIYANMNIKRLEEIQVASIQLTVRKKLQEAVDILFDNARTPAPLKGKQDMNLESLTEILEGKEGRFRLNLLGKRVDYSGRTVIVSGPHLRITECGLPLEMALKLFKPFLISEVVAFLLREGSTRVNRAKELIHLRPPALWWILEKICGYYSVFLNRAPTLHKFGVQAFDPVLLPTRAIELHPLVCGGFNADFDGDQMAVHLPLYRVGQFEIKTMMTPSANLFSPATGELLVKPSQDMVIGSYYLTLLLDEETSCSYENLSLKIFSSERDIRSALDQKLLSLHTPIFFQISCQELEIELTDESTLAFPLTSSSFSEYPILFLEEYKTDGKLQKLFFFTSLGIFVGRCINGELSSITNALIETTPGRVILAENFKLIDHLPTPPSEAFLLKEKILKEEKPVEKKGEIFEDENFPLPEQEEL